MIDAYGRKIDYLRISVTDRCNFRCQYCMPEEGIELRKHDEMLTFDEITRIVRIMSSIGIRKIKLTGGEPLVRKGVHSLVEDIRKIDGIKDITMTTNGYLLEDEIDKLVEKGLTGINISLDTLEDTLFKNITRVDGLERVLRGIKKTKDYKELNVKVNCVPLGLEEQDLKSIALLAKEDKIHVRFIEMMPIGLGKKYMFTSEAEIIKELEPEIGEFKPYKNKLGNGPSHYYEIEGFKGKIGFISALSHKFCHECNRIRLTSTGYLKTCLQYDIGVDLRTLLRNGSSDEEILKAIEAAILSKPMEHNFLNSSIDNEEQNGMSRIGG
ncbi:MAG: GTP 3',8-cyclase MoaA [Erysipelotrichales bacterium]|nr:GTP 3',8-cyclase MoaA [Erysipelotrichales bacterium]